jgi:molybdate transport system substrate-binding protein
VILSREGLTELIAAKRIVADTDVDLARVGVGVAVRAGIAKPDVGTVEGFRQALLNAKTVAVPGSTSGIWLVKELFPQLGVADKINVVVRPRGTDVTAMIVEGTADLGVLPTSEIAYAKGVQLAGNIAAEIQFMQTFSAATVAGSQQIEAARRLIAFLTSPRAFEAIRKGGMEPNAAS